MNEALIVINGQVLTEAQSMTIRVALDTLAIDINHGDLSDSEHSSSYKAHLTEIRKSLNLNQ